MRFATLVALAVVVSTTPGLAAPAPFAPNRANSGPHHAHPDHAHARAVTADHPSHPAHSGPHHAHPDHAAHARAVHPDHPEHPGPHHAFPDHVAHARAVTSDRHPGPHHNHPGHAGHARAVTSDILQVIESAFDSLPLARKRDVVTSIFQDLMQDSRPFVGSLKRDLSSDDYQSLLESLGLGGSGSTIDKRLKLPEISPSTESAISNAANVATIGGSIAKIWDAIDGSSSSSKRDETQFDERAFKIPASVTTWLKTIGNVGSIGAGGAAIVGAVDSGNSTLKREFIEADERALKIPAEVTTWLKTLGNVGSIGAGGAAIVGAVDGGSDSTMKREFIEADERALKIPASVTTWLKNAGNIFSIGAGGAAIVGALDGGSNSTLKRELDQAFDGVDLTTLLNGATSQFEERGKTSTKPSSSEKPSTSQASSGGDLLGKIASGFSLLGAGSTFLSDLENSTKREVATDAYGIGLERPHFVSTIPTFDERSLKIPAEVTTWLKTLGNVGSIGAGGAAIVGALDGGSNSTLKRELDDEVDLTTLLNGVSPKFEDRSVSSSEVSGLESVLGKVATAASVGGTLATVWSALDPSSSSTTSKRDFNLTSEEVQRLSGIDNPDILSIPVPSASDTDLISERSIVSSAEGILAQLLGGILGGSGGISIKRSALDSKFVLSLSPEKLQEIAAQLHLD